MDLLVLPELAFMPWLCATRDVNPDAWERAAVNQHLEQLEDLPARVVIGTRASGRYNDAFCWTAESGLRSVHRKTFLPDEPGFWEATWYERGPVEFQAFDTPVGRIGVSVARRCGSPSTTTRRGPGRCAAGDACGNGREVAGRRRYPRGDQRRLLRLKQPRGIRRGHDHGCPGLDHRPGWGRPARTTDAEPVAIRDIEPTEARVAKRTYPGMWHEIEPPPYAGLPGGAE